MGALSHIATPLFLEWSRSPSSPYKNSSPVDFFVIFYKLLPVCQLLSAKETLKLGFIEYLRDSNRPVRDVYILNIVSAQIFQDLGFN